MRFASIGPVTSSTLRELGLPVDIEAREYTIPGLIKAIVAHHETVRRRRLSLQGGRFASQDCLCRTIVLVVLGWFLLCSLASTTLSSDFPPDELLQHITAEGIAGAHGVSGRRSAGRPRHRHARLSTGRQLCAGAIRGDGIEAGGRRTEPTSRTFAFARSNCCETRARSP